MDRISKIVGIVALGPARDRRVLWIGDHPQGCPERGLCCFCERGLLRGETLSYCR
jgi:hypothetical protein